MQDLTFFYESASLDVKLQDKKFIHPFFHLFVCFFDCSCNSIVHVYLMHVFKKKKKKKRKKKKSHAGPVEE